MWYCGALTKILIHRINLLADNPVAILVTGNSSLMLMNKNLIRKLIIYGCFCVLTSCTSMSKQQQTQLQDEPHPHLQTSNRQRSPWLPRQLSPTLPGSRQRRCSNRKTVSGRVPAYSSVTRRAARTATASGRYHRRSRRYNTQFRGGRSARVRPRGV